MVIKGKLIELNRTTKDFKNGKKSEEKLFVTVAEVNLTDKQIEELQEAFKESGKKFTPAWILDFEGYVNTSTKYELPCKDLQDRVYSSVEDFVCDNEFNYRGADVLLALNIKEGAVYPKAIKFLTEGEPYDAFDEFAGIKDLPF